MRMLLQQEHFGTVRSDGSMELVVEFADILLPPKITNGTFAVNAKIGPEGGDFRCLIAAIEQAHSH